MQALYFKAPLKSSGTYLVTILLRSKHIGKFMPFSGSHLHGQVSLHLKGRQIIYHLFCTFT